MGLFLRRRNVGVWGVVITLLPLLTEISGIRLNPGQANCAWQLPSGRSVGAVENCRGVGQTPDRGRAMGRGRDCHGRGGHTGV